MRVELWLLADVGGTSTRVGLARDGRLDPGSTQSFRNADFAGLGEVLDHYLGHHRAAAPTALCAGVAGHVRGGTAQLTNLDWVIDSAELAKVTGVGDIHLINDLAAQGYALDDLPPTSVTPLIARARPPRDSARMVMGLGTGSNIAVVHRTPQGLFIPPAEAGHSSLPHSDGAIGAMISALSGEQAHRPLEALLSGPGLGRMHAHLNGETLDPGQIIAAHLGGDPGATATLATFVRLLGIVLGDLALNHLPMGGVYLIGGTARAVAPCLLALGFEDSFAAKGPYSQIMREIPLGLITDDTAALLGCARYLRQMFK
ncbi:glucokinase [Roseovarius lutimaris]|uniref:Glucokinase n=1 Tax=Roseovarius lutimaris TaxID=1005928 RepID=A0A1I4ZSK7_9RHOB|nr:glucokinase [Roseovarius lutimaris]SFN52970.1 glucokinase [Roseovarius lutimaris]